MARFPARRDTAATSTASGITSVSLEDILAAYEQLKSPIGEWMRVKGFPPETCLLILPESMRELLPYAPDYVKFSRLVQDALLVRDVAGLGSAQSFPHST